jgi:ribosome-binding protein aMBF1 (putative translation factor)
MKSYKDLKRRLLKDKALRKAYDELEPEFAIAQAVIKKRLERGLTQSELAKKIGTKQSAISRLESGNYNPSVSFLEKVAKALNLHLVVSLN